MKGLPGVPEIYTPEQDGVIIVGAGIGGLASAAALHKVEPRQLFVEEPEKPIIGRAVTRFAQRAQGCGRWAFLLSS